MVTKKVKIFSIASFLNDFGSEMVFSVWPLFVTTVIGADLVVLGLLDGIGNMVTSLSGALSGFLSDRFRRRKAFIVSGYMLSGVSKVGYSLASSWPMLIPLRVLDRFGKIRDAPRDAEVADDTKASERGRSFGIIDAFDHAGAVSGILASFFLLGALGYGQLFMIASIPPLFAAALVFLAIKEKRRGAGAVSFEFKLDSNFKRFLLASAFLALGSFSYSFVIIAAKDGFSEGSIPLLYLVMTLCAMAGAALFGRASDRFGRKRMMYVSSALLVLCAILIIVGGPAPLIVSFVAFGLHLGSIKPLQKTLASEIAPQDYKASALGTLQLISGLAALPASLAVGFLWEWVGPEAAFGFPILMVLLSALALSSVKE